MMSQLAANSNIRILILYPRIMLCPSKHQVTPDLCSTLLKYAGKMTLS